VRQRVYASRGEAVAAGPIPGVSSGSGKCVGVHVGADEAEEGVEESNGDEEG
jgi:hypothetical protein